MLKSTSVKIAQEMLINLLQRNSEYGRIECMYNSNFQQMHFETVKTTDEYNQVFELINKSGLFKVTKYSETYYVIKPVKWIHQYNHGFIFKFEKYTNALSNRKYYKVHICEKRYIKGFHSLED